MNLSLKKFPVNHHGTVIYQPIFAFDLNVEGSSYCAIKSSDQFEVVEHKIDPSVIINNDFMAKDIRDSVGTHQRTMTMIIHKNTGRYLLVDSSLFE